jgi:hypothetical protein
MLSVSLDLPLGKGSGFELRAATPACPGAVNIVWGNAGLTRSADGRARPARLLEGIDLLAAAVGT